MPRQPLYNEGSPVRTQPGQERMVTGAGAGRGVTLDESAFIGSVKAPLLDDSGAIAEGRGLAALGQGMENAGSAILALSREAAEARNHNAVQDIHNKQQMASAEMWARIEREPNTAKHAQIAEEFIQTAPGSWMDPNAPPVVRDEAEALTKRWAADVNSKVLVYSSRKELEKEEGSLIAIRETAEVTGDEAAYDQAVDRMVQRGYLEEEQGKYQKVIGRKNMESRRKQEEAIAKSEAIKSHKNDILVLSEKQTPAEIKAYISNMETLDPTDKKYLEDFVDGVERDGTSDILGKVTENIYNGNIDNEYEVDAWTLGNKFMTEILRTEMKDRVKGFDKLKAQKEREGPNGVKNFTSLYRKAKDWNPKLNTPEAASQYLDMMGKTRETVPEDLQSDVIEILDAKFGNSKTKKSVRPEIQTLVTSNLNLTMGKILQPYKDAVAALSEFAGAEPDDTDRLALDAARTELYKKTLEVNERESKIQWEMNEYFKVTPNPTIEGANKKLMSLLDPKTAIQALQKIRSKATGSPPVTIPPAVKEKVQSTSETPKHTDSATVDSMLPDTYVQEGDADPELRGPSTDLLAEPPPDSLSPQEIEGDEIPRTTDEEIRDMEKEMDAGKKKKNK